jgi:hypothetical protein
MGEYNALIIECNKNRISLKKSPAGAGLENI